MSPLIRHKLLLLILEKWLDLKPYHRPDRVWVREFLYTNHDGHPTQGNKWPVGYWILNENGFQQYPVWYWVRLETILSGVGHHYWPLKVNEVDKVRVSESGTATLSQLEEPGWYYYDVQLGPLYGQGWRVQMTREGKVLRQSEIWRS